MTYILECVRYGFRRSATYRAAWMAAALAGLLQLVVMVSVWTALMSAGGSAGYTLDDAVIYAVFVLVLWSANNTWIVRDIETEVREGRVERLLLRPVHIGLTYMSIGFGKVLFNLTVIGPPIIIVFLVWRPVDFPSISPLLAMCAALSILLSICLYLLIDLCIGLSSFWTVTTFGIDMIKENAIRFLSGATVPLIFYPDFIQAIAWVLPFKLMFFQPADLFVRKAEAGEYLSLFGGQLVWIAVLALIAFVVIRRVRKFISVAGG